MMKTTTFFITLLVVLLLASLTTAATPLKEEEYEFLFTRWVAKHNKAYLTSEFFSRYEIFKNNLDLITAHNMRQDSYLMSANKFADLTPQEFVQQHTGLRVNSVEMEKYQQEQGAKRALLRDLGYSSSPTKKDAPYINWFDKGVFPPVKNQLNCGSCWAFSTTTTLAATYNIMTKSNIDLSPQQLVDCDDTSYGCGGGLMDSALKWLSKSGGSCTEQDYPYEGKEGSCQQCTPVVRVNQTVPYTQPKFTMIPDDGYKISIQNGPIAVGIAAGSTAFQFYKSGVIRKCPDLSINHGVVLGALEMRRAYPTAEDSITVEAWGIRNSWGSDYGENGNVWIETNKQLCGLIGMSNHDVIPNLVF